MTSILNVGAETRVNTYTIDTQTDAQIATLADGSYVIVWSSMMQDGSGYGVYFQHYDATGHKIGYETSVATNTNFDQFQPTIMPRQDGGFSIGFQDTAAGDLAIQSYDYMGAPVGANGVMSYTNIANPIFVEVGSDGNFAIATTRTDNDQGGIYLNNSNTPINTTQTGIQSSPAMASLGDGGFIVLWQSDGEDGSGYGIYAQRFNSSYATVGGETLINTTTAGSQQLPSVTGMTDGGYVVAWQGPTSTKENGDDIFVQRYDVNGTKIGGETIANTYLANDQRAPAITALSDGGYVVVWISSGQDGSLYGIYAQRFDASDHKIGDELQVNTTTVGLQTLPEVTALSDGGFVVTWEGNGTGDTAGIFQKVFSAASNLSPAQYLYGTAFADVLDGGSNADHMWGGYGDDIYYVDDARDIVSESANQGYDTVESYISHTLEANVEALVLLGAAPINGYGNDLDNVITGNPGFNYLYGGAGADYLDGAGGNDDLVGASQDDSLYGGDGNDYLDGGADDDTLYGGAGQDVVHGGSGEDYIDGGAGNDTLEGEDDNDTVSGGDGNDSISGGAGTNTLDGGAGDDTFILLGGRDIIDGGSGSDTLDLHDLTGPVVANLTTGQVTFAGPPIAQVSEVENISGSWYSDTITGDANNNILHGDIGGDVIDGGAGNDQIFGDDGADTASYASAAAAVSVSLLLQDSWQDTLGAGSDYLDSIENLTGSKYNDTLTGDNGNNLLDGGAGADVMKGGLGDDTYVVGNAYDNVGERLNEGTDTVLSSITYTLPSNVENLTLTGTADINATGNSDNNTLNGNAGNNLLDGGAGADKMYGGVGNDTYVVNNSFDQANENAGEGTDTVQSSITFTIGNNVENLTLTGTANINGTGNALANIIAGNAGNNVLKGGAGADTFVFAKFGTANGLDHLNDFVTAVDHLSFTGADYGIAVGHHLTTGELSTTGVATSAAGIGQFVYNSTTHTLSWDSNGVTAGGMTDIVVFDNAVAPAAADFLFT